MAKDMPKGVETNGKVKIAVNFDKEVFDNICQYGLNHGMSFSEAANDLAKCGVLDVTDAGEFSPNS